MNRRYRDTVIAGNWKMNMLSSEAGGYADALRPFLPRTGADRCQVAVCVPYPLIPAAAAAFHGTPVTVGAQNVSEHVRGAYTGEVSAGQLRDLGAGCVIIGHSERRRLFGETDALVSLKLRAALEHGLRPIVCVGETLEQREAGVTPEHIALQLKLALGGVSAGDMRRTVIAYEPVWAIGTGRTASPEDAQAVICAIRAVIRGLYDARTARAVSILYGGSMNEKNAGALLCQPDIDGGLIGGASLDPAAFGAVIVAARETASEAQA